MWSPLRFVPSGSEVFYNKKNYTEEEEENKEKSNKITTIKRIEKAPSIEEANEGFLLLNRLLM